MSQLFYGSICITDLLEHAKGKHSAFVKGNNGKIYANISAWLNDEEDKYGNIMALKLSATKDAITKDAEQGKVYIGNLKESDSTSKPLSNKEAKEFESIADDLPF